MILCGAESQTGVLLPGEARRGVRLRGAPTGLLALDLPAGTSLVKPAEPPDEWCSGWNRCRQRGRRGSAVGVTGAGEW